MTSLLMLLSSTWMDGQRRNLSCPTRRSELKGFSFDDLVVCTYYSGVINCIRSGYLMACIIVVLIFFFSLTHVTFLGEALNRYACRFNYCYEHGRCQSACSSETTRKAHKLWDYSHKRVHFGSYSGRDFAITVQSISQRFTVFAVVIQVLH